MSPDTRRAKSPLVDARISKLAGSRADTKGCRAVFRVDERREERIAPGQPKDVDGLFIRERVNGPGPRALVLERHVSPRHAIEPIGRMQPEHIGHRMPLDDVPVDVERISGNFVAGLAPSGISKVARNFCGAIGSVATIAATSSRSAPDTLASR